MSKVILMCGKICSGKSTYSEKLRLEEKAVVLSVDEITLALFGRDAGENHDTYVRRTENYLFEKSAEIIKSGINVILDWGFWTKNERDFAKGVYHLQGIDCELHYIDISDEQWQRNIQKRNAEVLAGKTNAYYIDDGLLEKFISLFEEPDESEIDIKISSYH